MIQPIAGGEEEISSPWPRSLYFLVGRPEKASEPVSTCNNATLYKVLGRTIQLLWALSPDLRAAPWDKRAPGPIQLP